MMETWFLNHVLGLSLSVLLLGLPGTPVINGPGPAATGMYHPAATAGPGLTENGETSTPHSSESLSPSQRSLLLTHPAGSHSAPAANLDTEQTQTFTETSSGSLETTSLSTEPLSSPIIATTESSSGIGSSSSTSSSGTSSSSSSGIGSSSSTSSSGTSSSGTSSSGTSSSGTSSDTSSSSGIGSSGSSISSGDWKEFVITDQVPGVSHTVSWEARSLKFTEETILPQDSPESTLWLGDATELSSQTAVQTDSMYTSTTSRVGERTLLSVTSSTSNSTSFAFTEESNPDQPLSAWGIPARTTGTEDYTQSAPSTRTGSGETTDQHMTQSFKTMFPDGGDRGVSEGIPISTGPPNATQHQHTTAAEETSESTPPLRVTDFSTDQSESMSSAPTVTSAAGGPTSITGTDVEFGSNAGASTESSTAGHSSSTLNQEGTERLTYQTREDNRDLGLSTAPPTISSNTTGSPQTETPELATELFLTTTPVPVTDRSQITREYTLKATASTTTTTATAPTLPVTSSSTFSSTASTSVSEMQTDTAFPFTIPTTTASTVALQTPAITPTYLAPPEQTNGPSTRTANPTDFPSLHVETSTGSTTVSTSRSQYVTTTYQHSSPTRNTEALHTTGKQAVRGTTEQVLTASPTDMQPTKAPPPVPRNPCVSNPCMNGGKCVSYKEHQYICHCQQAWTGPNCNQDMDECEKDPCPLGSRCVNTRGSFSCECPLGFDLENGRTCSRAKTFLGTFSVNKLPHDPVVFRSATIHEIYREIIQLLNASLSAFQGYSRSTLSKKEEDGVRILAVNMFSISTDVTSAEVFNSIKMSLSNCSSSLSHCRMVLQHQLAYEVESLCVAQKTQCDTERSTCTDSSGTAHCQCFLGYYKHNPDDLSCLECGDGYKLENGTCVPCMFGFGGFNCGNFYKLIAVVVSPAGGALLLILIIALIVTCCKKDKNDINKIIFKSGDLQMSPYADFPKNNRISMEWGRETIEMQENGSTKNLLQMTDIYYSPALRNSDLERNGLYPFTGLPGSRHSCIYPAQWNPSFISDDSRRRDYF
ncbi:protein HEG [Echeneis naucrates]|uniref:protein HEG n=1 Tax=Echeneis naucrates TaxID=173247 RepID=UPI0011139318|nr:protein HEG homolog 1 [Echeneis naucrates]